MPHSKPIFQETVLSNGTLFVGLYLRSRKNDINGTEDDQFYWLQTTASGSVLDSRGNALNDYFTSLASALATPPSGYSAVVDNFDDRKDIGYNSIYPYRDGDASYAQTLAEYSAAATAGATYILVDIYWGDVFLTLTEQNTNASTKWLKFDNLINYAKGLFTTTGAKMMVSIRVILSKYNRENYDLFGSTQSSGFYGLSESALDEENYPARVISDGGTRGIFSLADNTRTGNGVGQGLDFVQKVLQRYNSSLAATNQWNWFSVDMTAQHEGGYNYENSQYATESVGSPNAPTSYDYSSFSVSGFKTAMQVKYATIGALNTAWGSSYGAFSDIIPPKTGSTSPSSYELDMVYSTTKGKDWWFWNYTLVKNFNISCRAKGITYAPTAKYAIEGGSFYDSPRRMLINVSDMGSYSDMIKTVMGRHNGIIQCDILASNYAKKKGTEINTSDMLNVYNATSVAQAKGMMLNLAYDSIGRGNAKDVLFMSNSGFGLYHNALIEAVAETKTALTNSNGRVGVVGSGASYSLGQLLDDPNNLNSFWVSAGGSEQTPVNMNQSTEILTTTGGCAFPLSIYAIHQYCLNSLGIKSNDYDAAGADSALQNDWNLNRILIQVPTHSITYVSGGLAKVSMKIVGVTDGITYVSNSQNTGFLRDNNVPNQLDNNHPRRIYDPSLINDSDFYLPATQSYDVKITATVANVTFRLDGFYPYVALHKQKVTPAMGEITYRIVTANIARENKIKQVKINCNRDSETDTL
jgi:hypothetical protein